MTHASVELIEAIKGDCGARSSITNAYAQWACAPGVESTPVGVYAYIGDGNTTRDARQDVSCPACLRLMREATDPVRWDALEERGLAPKLEAA